MQNPCQAPTMSTPKTSVANHYLLESELSPKVNIAMSTEEIPADDSNSGEVGRKLAKHAQQSLNP